MQENTAGQETSWAVNCPITLGPLKWGNYVWHGCTYPQMKYNSLHFNPIFIQYIISFLIQCGGVQSQNKTKIVSLSKYRLHSRYLSYIWRQTNREIARYVNRLTDTNTGANTKLLNGPLSPNGILDDPFCYASSHFWHGQQWGKAECLFH